MKTQAKFWQETDNAEWFTDQPPRCGICRKKTNTAVELRLNDGSAPVTAGFSCGKKCVKTAIADVLSYNPEAEFILFRLITYRPVSQ